MPEKKVPALPTECGRIRDAAEIRVAVFAAHRPIPVDGPFDAAADSPAHAHHRLALVGGVEQGQARPDPRSIGLEEKSPRATPPVAKVSSRPKGVARAAANRALDVGLHRRSSIVPPVRSACGIEHGESRGPDEIRAVDRAFEADDPIVELLIISNVAVDDRACASPVRGSEPTETAGRRVTVSAVSCAPKAKPTWPPHKPVQRIPSSRSRATVASVSVGEACDAGSRRRRAQIGRDGRTLDDEGSGAGSGAVAEFVAEADLELVAAKWRFAQEEPMRRVSKAGRQSRGVGEFAEIGIAVFAAHRPRSVERTFGAAAERPADALH